MILRLIIVVQVFSLLSLVLMPLMIRLLNETAGKVLYSLLLLLSIGFSIALRYAVSRLE